jgi:hypothetical protein
MNTHKIHHGPGTLTYVTGPNGLNIKNAYEYRLLQPF